MKRRRGLVLVALGLALAALSGLAVLEITRQAVQPVSAKDAPQPQVEPIAMVYVVMAGRDIPEGVALTAADLTTREFPGAFVPTAALGSPESAIGKYATSRIFKGQIVVAPLLSEVRRLSQLSAKVPEGKVAMAVLVNDAMNSLGALRAGDRVDILLTLDLSRGVSREKPSSVQPTGAEDLGSREQPVGLLSTQVTLQNAEILTVGASSVETPDLPSKTQPSPSQASRTITFALDHQDAITLKFAKDSGGIMDLVVRSPGDQRLVKTEGVTFDSIYRQFRFRFPEPVK